MKTLRAGKYVIGCQSLFLNNVGKYTFVEKNTVKELCFNCKEDSCSGNDFCDSCGHCNCTNTPCDNCGSCECSYNVCEYCGECNCSGCVEQSDED